MLPSLDATSLSEEDIYTDDSSESDDEGSTVSCSESEDPTFVLDTSQHITAGNNNVKVSLVRK